MNDPVEAAAVLVCRLTRAQGFTEANKRTGLLLARWVLDRNDVDGATLLPPDDREVADLLVKAASGLDVEDEAVALLPASRSMLTGQGGIGEQRRTTHPPDSATGQIGMVRTVAGPATSTVLGHP